MNKAQAIEINFDDEDNEIDFDENDEELDFENDYIEVYEPDEEERVYAIRPNKTQIKIEIALIANLAEEISGLTPNQIKGLGLPENIHNAVIQVAGMPLKGARKRQLKYITGELRKIELADIQEKLARLKSKSVHAVREQHWVERWRDKLITDENRTILTQLLALYPQADTQYIRQLQRNAKKESLAQKPPKSSRLLYHYLKSLYEELPSRESGQDKQEDYFLDDEFLNDPDTIA